jgi:hypothetical protein
MEGVTYLLGGIIPCQFSDERVWLWRGTAAPSPTTLLTRQVGPESKEEINGVRLH